MDITLQKETISLCTGIGKTSVETNAEADVIVPDVKPDIGKILQVDATAKTTGSELQNERILVYGEVVYHILYLAEGDEKTVHSMNAKSTFTDIAEIKGLTPQMDGSVSCDVVGVEFKVLNGRKISVRATILIDAQAEYCSEAEAVVGTEGTELKTLSDKMSYTGLEKYDNLDFKVADKLIIPVGMPSAGEILKVDGKILDKSVKVINNKVIVKGELSAVVLYTDEAEGGIKTISGAIPFTEILEAEGISGDKMSHTYLDIDDLTWSLGTDEDGDTRVINLEFGIKARGKSISNAEINIIKDCYRLAGETEIVTKDIEFYRNGVSLSHGLSLKEKVYAGGGEPKINQVYNVVARAYIDEINPKNNELEVKGVADTYLLYLSDDTDVPIYSIKKEIPFTETIPCNGAKPETKWDLEAQITGASYTLDDNSAEIRCNVAIEGFGTEKEKRKIITDIKLREEEAGKENASVVVYFVQEQDCLWDIAKRYTTTIEAIKEANELSDDASIAGKMLIIPHFK